MRCWPLSLAAPLLLAACASPAAPAGSPDTSFDAAAWLARARPTANVYVDGTPADEPARSVARARMAELDRAVGWERACDSYWDREAEAFVYAPERAAPPDLRGVYTVTDIAPGEAVVTVVCAMAAYQGSYALVHVRGGRAALLLGQDVTDGGDPLGPPTAVYSTPTLDAGRPEFETFSKSRGIGDCGVFARYRVVGFGRADLVEARARRCNDKPADGPEDVPPPRVWPVVFPRP